MIVDPEVGKSTGRFAHALGQINQSKLAGNKIRAAAMATLSGEDNQLPASSTGELSGNPYCILSGGKNSNGALLMRSYAKELTRSFVNLEK